MDRDKRWDRVERAYRLLVDADGARADDPVEAIRAAYEADFTDEFVEPTVIGGYAGMRDGDGILMANFRADRAREILSALLVSDFDDFDRGEGVKFAGALGLIEYSEALNPVIAPLFPSLDLERVFGELLAENGHRQLRIAETEKYAHVTFFFNGGESRFSKVRSASWCRLPTSRRMIWNPRCPPTR